MRDDTPPAPARCDAVVANTGDILLIADDPQGFPAGVPIGLSAGGVVTAYRGRRCVFVACIPEPIRAYARQRGEVLFRCVRTGNTVRLDYPGARSAA